MRQTRLAGITAAAIAAGLVWACAPVQPGEVRVWVHNLSDEPVYVIAVTKLVQIAVGPGQVGVAFEGPAVDDEFSVVGRMCVVVAEVQVQGDQGDIVLRVEDETVTATPPRFLELPPDATSLPQAPNFSCPGE